MKTFKIIYKTISEELVDDTKHGMNRYHIKDGKVCFLVNMYEVTRKMFVNSVSEKAIRNKYNTTNIVSVELIKDDPNVFDVAAGNNFVGHDSKPIEILRKDFLRVKDVECNEEVQEEYKRDPKGFWNKPIEYSEF